MISELYDILNETADLVKEFQNDASRGALDWNSTWSTYLKLFYADLDSIRSILVLAKSGKYRDCFIILRTVFEYYFLLLLMIKGKKYRDTKTYHITQTTSKTRKEARDLTYEKWVADKKVGKPEYQKFTFEKGHADDVIRVTFETEGLYNVQDKEKTGEVVPFFVFAFEEYDPDPNFLSELSSLWWHDSSYSAIVEKHRYLYSHFLNVNKIATNIKLNNLLSPEQLDRFWVHYNYLSSFTHPTKRGLLGTDAHEYSALETVRTDRCLESLVLMYAAHFQAMLISLITTFFSDRNKFTDLSGYIKQAEKLETVSKDFWFIYNNPTEFDIAQSEMQKQTMKLKMQVPSGVLYYSDPYE